MPALLRSYLFWIAVAVILVLAYMATPFMAAAHLAEAVRNRDAPAILARVDKGALGRSLTRQVLRAYLAIHGKEQAASPFAQQIATGLAANALYPVLHQMTTPDALSELLERGWPEEGGKPKPVARLGIDGVSGALAKINDASFTGLTHFRMNVDVDGDPKRRLGWRFRISGFRWKLYAIDLSPEILRDIVARLPVAERMKIEDKGGERRVF